MRCLRRGGGASPAGGGAFPAGRVVSGARGAVDVVVIGPPLNGEERPVTMVTNITMTTRGVNVLFHSVSLVVSHPPLSRGARLRRRRRRPALDIIYQLRYPADRFWKQQRKSHCIFRRAVLVREPLLQVIVIGITTITTNKGMRISVLCA